MNEIEKIEARVCPKCSGYLLEIGATSWNIALKGCAACGHVFFIPEPPLIVNITGSYREAVLTKV